MSPVSPSKARQERESAAEGTYAAPVAVPPRGCPPGADVQSRGAARDPALCAAHRARGTRDRVRVPVALENTTWKVIGCLVNFNPTVCIYRTRGAPVGHDSSVANHRKQES